MNRLTGSLCRGLFNSHTILRWPITFQRNFATRDYYDILYVSRSCSNKEIRDSFTKLSKKFHPDICKTGDAKQNAKRFQEIVEAYKVLSKQDTRDMYDAMPNKSRGLRTYGYGSNREQQGTYEWYMKHYDIKPSETGSKRKVTKQRTSPEIAATGQIISFIVIVLLFILAASYLISLVTSTNPFGKENRDEWD